MNSRIPTFIPAKPSWQKHASAKTEKSSPSPFFSILKIKSRGCFGLIVSLDPLATPVSRRYNPPATNALYKQKQAPVCLSFLGNSEVSSLHYANLLVHCLTFSKGSDPTPPQLGRWRRRVSGTEHRSVTRPQLHQNRVGGVARLTRRTSPAAHR